MRREETLTGGAFFRSGLIKLGMPEKSPQARMARLGTENFMRLFIGVLFLGAMSCGSEDDVMGLEGFGPIVARCLFDDGTQCNEYKSPSTIEVAELACLSIGVVSKTACPTNARTGTCQNSKAYIPQGSVQSHYYEGGTSGELLKLSCEATEGTWLDVDN